MFPTVGQWTAIGNVKMTNIKTEKVKKIILNPIQLRLCLVSAINEHTQQQIWTKARNSNIVKK